MTSIHIERYLLNDDGLVPNNEHMPLIVYRGAFDVSGVAGAEAAIEAHFASHDWRNAWVNGIFDFHHYHATTHEVLGIARGFADVQFGGQHGPVLHLAAGDAVMIPPGVGHCRKHASDDLSVVGAYPDGVDYDTKRAIPDDHAQALKEIPEVPAPATDPILGAEGPATELADRATTRA